MSPDAPGGFSLTHYLYDVQSALKEAFYVGEQYPVFKQVPFAPTYQFQDNVGASSPESEALLGNIDVPACLLDFYGFKTDPSFDEFKFENTSVYSNLGNLGIYLYMRALVLVSSGDERSWLTVRKLAADVAGVVTESERFGGIVGMSQVTEIGEVAEIRRRSNFYVAWEVLWQHSVELEPPDYSRVELRRALSDDCDDSDVTDWDEIDPSIIETLCIGGTSDFKLYPGEKTVYAGEAFDFQVRLGGENPVITSVETNTFGDSQISGDTVRFTGTASGTATGDEPVKLFVNGRDDLNENGGQFVLTINIVERDT